MVSAGLDFCSTKVWRYQSGNQNPYIEEKENVQKTNNDLENIHIKLQIEYREPH
jgi:hypothetical protein